MVHMDAFSDGVPMELLGFPLCQPRHDSRRVRQSGKHKQLGDKNQPPHHALGWIGLPVQRQAGGRERAYLGDGCTSVAVTARDMGPAGQGTERARRARAMRAGADHGGWAGMKTVSEGTWGKERGT